MKLLLEIIGGLCALVLIPALFVFYAVAFGG